MADQSNNGFLKRNGSQTTGDRESVHLSGKVLMSDLPPHCGMIVSLNLYEVDGPHTGIPPAMLAPATGDATSIEIFNETGAEFEPSASRDISFSIEHSPGYFYALVHGILLRKLDDVVIAHVDTFPYYSRPLHLTADLESVRFPVRWPFSPIAELDCLGVI